MRYYRRETKVQVPKRAAMRERDRKGVRVVYQSTQRSESSSEESEESRRERRVERSGRRKAPLFPFFTPR